MGGTRMLNNQMHLRELKKPNGTRNEGEMMEFRAQMLAEGGSPGPPCRGMPVGGCLSGGLPGGLPAAELALSWRFRVINCTQGFRALPGWPF